MGFIAWLIMGLVAGVIAHAILGRDGRLLPKLITGCIGAMIGGWIGDSIFHHGLVSFFSPWSWALAIGGSVLVLWIYQMITKKR